MRIAALQQARGAKVKARSGHNRKSNELSLKPEVFRGLFGRSHSGVLHDSANRIFGFYDEIPKL